MTDPGHDWLQRDLYRKRRAAKREIAWSEVQILRSDGGRFDVYACRTHDAQGTETFVGYEVKANARDLESDLSTGKWRRYLPACDEFLFALGPKLEDRIDDIPAPAGVMVYKGDRWQRRRKPQGGHRTVDPIAIWRRLATRDHWNPPTAAPKTRLERLEEYERAESLSHLIRGRVADEIAAQHRELASREWKVQQGERRLANLQALEARLADVPATLTRLGLLLSVAGRRIDPSWSEEPISRRRIGEFLDELLEPDTLT